MRAVGQQGGQLQLGVLGTFSMVAVACSTPQTSPFSDLETVCGQGLSSHAAYVAAFGDLGWRDVDPARVPDAERAAMIDAMTYAGLGPTTEVSPDLLSNQRAVATQRIERLLSPPDQVGSVLRRRDGDQSALLLRVNTHSQGSGRVIELSCTLMGIFEDETAWIASLVEDRRMRETFTEIDPDANFSNQIVSPVDEDAPPGATGALFHLYPDRAEAALGRPLRYDLVFTIGTLFRLEGETQ